MTLYTVIELAVQTAAYYAQLSLSRAQSDATRECNEARPHRSLSPLPVLFKTHLYRPQPFQHAPELSIRRITSAAIP